MNTLKGICAAALLLTLIACGGGSSSTTRNMPTPTPTPTGTPFPNDQHIAQTPPVKMGTSGGNSTDSTTMGSKITCCSGTLGNLLLRGGTLFVLSNNHVLDKSDQGAANDPITQPGLVDDNCGQMSSALVAHMTQAAALKPNPCNSTPCTGPAPSNVDAAMAQIVSGTVDTSGAILDLGAAGSTSIAPAPPSQTLAVPSAVLGANEGVAKSGRSTGLTCSNLGSVLTTVSVQYNVSCGGALAFTSTFTNQVIINGGTFSASGDSGSLVVTSDTARPVGLLFAGNSTSTTANPIQDIIKAFTSAAGTPSVVGGVDHAVSCAPQASAPSANPTPGGATSLSISERQRVAAVQQRRSAELMQDSAVTSVEIGASDDNPGEGALLIQLSGATRSPIPATVDGVRTKIVLGPDSGLPQTPVLSPEDMERAAVVKESHATALMSQGGIQGVGVGRSGDNPAETAIVIYVINGQTHPEIPQLLGGVRTKIVEGDRFRAFGWGKETKPAAKCVKK